MSKKSLDKRIRELENRWFIIEPEWMKESREWQRIFDMEKEHKQRLRDEGYTDQEINIMDQEDTKEFLDRYRKPNGFLDYEAIKRDYEEMKNK